MKFLEAFFICGGLFFSAYCIAVAIGALLALREWWRDPRRKK